eukprot:6051817-Pleurochrysis_carterae.AAC.1
MRPPPILHRSRPSAHARWTKFGICAVEMRAGSCIPDEVAQAPYRVGRLLCRGEYLSPLPTVRFSQLAWAAEKCFESFHSSMHLCRFWHAGDRPIEITLERCWRALSLDEKVITLLHS